MELTQSASRVATVTNTQVWAGRIITRLVVLFMIFDGVAKLMKVPSKRYGVLYADARGVSRVYEMSLSNGVWKICREAQGFHQRFTGRFSRDVRTVKASWKRSVNGTRWQHDFDVTYTKTK